MAAGSPCSNRSGLFEDKSCIAETRAVGVPMPPQQHVPQQWVPDERDSFISWLRSEFAAANAIIDSLCQHLQFTGSPGEYDYVLSCVQQRRFNWSAVLHMQQYYSIEDVVGALQQAGLRKRQVQSPLVIGPADPDSSFWKKGSWNGQRDRRHGMLDAELGLDKREFSGKGCKPDEEIGKKNRHGFKEPQTQVKLPENVIHSPTKPESPQSAGSGNGYDQYHPGALPPFPCPAQTDSKLQEMNDWKTGTDSHQNQIMSKQQEGCFAESSTARDFMFNSKEEEDKKISQMKISKSFRYYENIEGRSINLVEGLKLFENVFDHSESDKLYTLFTEFQTVGRRPYGGNKGNQLVTSKKAMKGKISELLALGGVPNSSNDECQGHSPVSDEIVEKLPAILKAAIDRLMQWHILPANKRPDSFTINMLDEGDFTQPQLWNQELESPFCIITLLSECMISFGKYLNMDMSGEIKGQFKLNLPVGSVAVLQGNCTRVARYAVPSASVKRCYMVLGKASSRRSFKNHFGGSQQRPAMLVPQVSPPPPLGIGRGNISHGPPPNVTVTNSPVGGYSALGPIPVSSNQIISNVSNSQVQPIFSPAAGPYPPPPMPVMVPRWSVPRPGRLINPGTGVFFPYNASPSGPGRPSNAQQRRQGSLLQKMNSLPASFRSQNGHSSLASSKSTNHITALETSPRSEEMVRVQSEGCIVAEAQGNGEDQHEQLTKESNGNVSNVVDQI